MRWDINVIFKRNVYEDMFVKMMWIYPTVLPKCFSCTMYLIHVAQRTPFLRMTKIGITSSYPR